MKRMIAMICMIVIAFAAVGCTSVDVNDGNVDVKAGASEVSVKDGDANVEIKNTASSEEDWCPAGTTVNTNTPQGTVKSVIEGEVSSGKYAGYCHMTASVDSGTDSMEIDYYYKEDGSGYQVMEVNGQKIETSWTNPDQ